MHLCSYIYIKKSSHIFHNKGALALSRLPLQLGFENFLTPMQWFSNYGMHTTGYTQAPSGGEQGNFFY